MKNNNSENKYIWVVSDIHGMADPLNRLLNFFNLYNTEKIIFLGDYVDRGPSSKEVFDIISNIKEPKILLIGNHEKMMLEFLYNEQRYKELPEVWFANKGDETLISFGINPKIFFNKNTIKSLTPEYVMQSNVIDKKYFELFNQFKYSHCEKIKTEKKEFNFIFVHAGLIPDIALDKQLSIQTNEQFESFLKENLVDIEESMLWIRDKFLKADPQFLNDNILIHGHTPVHILNDLYFLKFKNFDPDKLLPFIKYNDKGNISSIDIDTSCVYGGKLTALGLNEECLSRGEIKIVQVDTRAGYYKLNIKVSTLYF